MRNLTIRLRDWLFVILVCAAMGAASPGSAKETLHFLCWAGVDDPALLEAFEKDTGISIQFKTFVGADAMYSLLTNSKNQYDVAMAGQEYIGKLYADGRLAILDPADYDLRQYIPTFQKLPVCYAKDNMIALPIEFGANGLAYNTSVISASEASSYAILMSDKVKGKVGVWDRYLPIMGVLSKSLGNEAPYDISDEKFMALKKHLLALRQQLSVIAPNFPVLIDSLARGETVVVPGGALFFAVTLQGQGIPIDWIIPKEGGIMWLDSLVILNDAPHPNLAKRFLQWMCTPKAQAMLAGKKAFAASVPNAAAYPLMHPELRKLLKMENGEEAEALAKKLVVRTLPVQQNEKTWQNAWDVFKATPARAKFQ